MVITPRAGGLGPGCPLGQRWGGGTAQLLEVPPELGSPAAFRPALPNPERAVPDGRARLEKTPAKERDPAALLPESWDCGHHAGAAVREKGGWGAGEGRGIGSFSSSLRDCGSRMGRTL